MSAPDQQPELPAEVREAIDCAVWSCVSSRQAGIAVDRLHAILAPLWAAKEKEIAELKNALAIGQENCDQLRAEVERLTKKQPINTHVRLFDLVRFMRSELHQADLITDDEYVWLCQHTFPNDPKTGSPSPRRLEDYDALRAQLAEFQRINQADYVEAGWQRAREVEAQLAAAQDALHKCYAATGEEAGDACDFRALVNREQVTVGAVEEMRKERDLFESQLAAAQEDKETYGGEHVGRVLCAVRTFLKDWRDGDFTLSGYPEIHARHMAEQLANMDAVIAARKEVQP